MGSLCAKRVVAQAPACGTTLFAIHFDLAFGRKNEIEDPEVVATRCLCYNHMLAITPAAAT